MSNETDIVVTGNLLEVHLTVKLTTEFYERLVPIVDQHIKEQGRIRILMVMHDFHGWTAGAMWEDVKFAMHHWKDIERLAIVGETKWEKGMATFCKPFTKATIRYFDSKELEAARAWIVA
jgi:hypothetical protein